MVMKASTILNLKTGVYQMAVNSDDGFSLSVDDLRDVFIQPLGLFNAGRGAANTFFNFVVLEDGLYPFQLIWWQGGGGANVEWFTVDATTSEQVLVNDLAHSNAFRAKPVNAFRPASISSARPVVRLVKPTPGARSVATNTTIEVTIIDGIAKVVTNSIQLLLNGSALPATVAQASGVTTISATLPGALPVLSGNSATLVFSDDGSPVLTRTNSWNFTAESSLPKALFVVANPAALNPSDAAVKARLESVFGFEVVAVGDAASQTSDADRKVVIVNSSTVGSGNVGTKFQKVAVPIVTWEQALEDEYLFTLDSATDHGGTGGQTDVIITDAAHPLAGGLNAGPHTVVNGAATFSWGLPAGSAKIVATLADGTASPCLYAFDPGAVLIDGVTTAPARRVHIFLDNDTFALLNADGIKLFDAALIWAANISSAPPPRFNPPVLAVGSVSLSWTGTGVLQEATNLTGNASDWSDVNPQPSGKTFDAPVSSAVRKFYRIRQ